MTSELQPTKERTLLGRQELCMNCVSDYTTFCSHCEEQITLDNNAGTGDFPLCQSCYDDYYYRCTRCDAIMHNDNCHYTCNGDDPYCYDCYDRMENGIHDYDYRPDPIFYGHAPRFFGVELEIDNAGEYDSNAKELMDLVNYNDDHIYCKHDGSLSDGFEIVTHPMSLEYHEKTMNWRVLLDRAISMGYTSHKTDTCGLHIHVSRRAFGETEERQDECIARILYFFEKHWNELLEFSRRTIFQLERWAARYGYKEQPQEILQHAKQQYGRYTCVNLSNSSTVEFRMFRGTLKLNTLIATLQLVDKVCDVALYLSDSEIKSMPWSAFVSGCTQPELIQYLKEQKLYVNEEVDTEAEV